MPGLPQRIDDYEAAYPADTSVIAHARNDFAAWLSRVTLDDDAVGDLTVVLSELLANAVLACDGADPPTVHVLACVDGHDLAIEVRNPLTRPAPRPERWDLDDPLRGGGRGLVIVESLVDEVDIEHDQRVGATCVRARRALAHSA